MSSFLSAILALAVFSLLHFSFSRLYNHYAFSNASAKLGCAAPKTLPSRDPLFGIDTVVSTFKSIKDHCRMRTTQKQTRLYGHTFQSFPFGRRVITTISPRNVQTVLSLEHEKFGVGPIRRPAEDMVGKGIISNDGKVWEHGRSMIRPAFARSQIADRGMFERHVERLLALLSQDNSVVDLQPLFDRLVRWPDHNLNSADADLDTRCKLRVYLWRELPLLATRLARPFAKVHGCLQHCAKRRRHSCHSRKNEVSSHARS